MGHSNSKMLCRSGTGLPWLKLFHIRDIKKIFAYKMNTMDTNAAVGGKHAHKLMQTLKDMTLEQACRTEACCHHLLAEPPRNAALFCCYLLTVTWIPG